MRKYFSDYINYIAAILQTAEAGTLSEPLDDAFYARFETMLSRMKHERICHLLVTVLFAILTVMSLGILMQTPGLQSALLFLLFLILVVPYVHHYYFLENGVQKLYKLWDKLKNLSKS
ncbi:MAG: hypothetical protein LBM59_05805 [Ruminococcus sp.]|jgi:hypothetical protein|nr:hypothetical protein [Ruminococcus sp.]